MGRLKVCLRCLLYNNNIICLIRYKSMNEVRWLGLLFAIIVHVVLLLVFLLHITFDIHWLVKGYIVSGCKSLNCFFFKAMFCID